MMEKSNSIGKESTNVLSKQELCGTQSYRMHTTQQSQDFLIGNSLNLKILFTTVQNSSRQIPVESSPSIRSPRAVLDMSSFLALLKMAESLGLDWEIQLD